MFRLIITLSLFFAITTASSQGNRKECATCRKSYQCKDGKCWNRHCVLKADLNGSKRKCFAQACDSCSAGTDCVTRSCVDGRCIQETTSNRAVRCTTSTLRAECARCVNDGDCSTDKCWGGRCVYDTALSMDKCGFQADCSTCKGKRDCLSFRCKKGLCVTPSNRCTGSPECSTCTTNKDCAVGSCWRNVCVKRSKASRIKCGFKDSCESCTSKTECISNRCNGNVCMSFNGNSC